ncbi:TetR family transcriptional regulator [Rhodobacterales bacterium HKCCE2091]|nr:TetR family transcriptional regulator [Rhodobacterales bacterium HKCCE2091]
MTENTATAADQAKQDDREAKRLSILKAAAAFFNSRGFHNTSMADVANALGVSKPFLYYYLKDKEDLIFQCSRIATQELHELLDEVRSAEVTGWERLEMLFRRYARVMTTDFGICLIRSTAPGSLRTDSREQLWTGRRRLNREVEKIVAEGIADGSIRSCDPRMLSFAMFGAFNWLSYWYDENGRKSPETIAEDFLDMFARGVVRGKGDEDAGSRLV